MLLFAMASLVAFALNLGLAVYATASSRDGTAAASAYAASLEAAGPAAYAGFDSYEEEHQQKLGRVETLSNAIRNGPSQFLEDEARVLAGDSCGRVRTACADQRDGLRAAGRQQLLHAGAVEPDAQPGGCCARAG